MNFLLDENFPHSALAQLQQAGHTAAHALDIFSRPALPMTGSSLTPSSHMRFS